MRILILCHSFPPDSIGGIERMVEGLAHDLPALGHTVGIVTRRSGGAPGALAGLERETLPSGATVFRLTGESGQITHFLRQHDRLDRHFAALLAEFAPDVVHCFQLLNLSPAFLEMAARLRVPIVISLQDFYFACPLANLQKTTGQPCRGPEGGRECASTCFAWEGAAALPRWVLRAVYFRRLLDLADRVICPTPFVVDYFVEQYGLPRALIHQFENGVERFPRSAVPRRLPRERGQLNLAFLGAVVPHKGPHRVLEALAQAGLPRVRLDVNGTIHNLPDYVENLRQAGGRIAGLDLRLNGPYQPDAVPALLADADVLVVPSQVPETFALVCREALAQGVPLLVSRLGALPEAIANGDTGLAFDPFDPAELAAHLRALWEDEALYARLREGAEHSRVMFTDQHAQRTAAEYAAVEAASLRHPRPKTALLAELSALRALLLQNDFT